MFGGDMDIKRAIFFIAVNPRVKTELPFTVDKWSWFPGLGWKSQFADFDFGRCDAAVGIDKRANLQIGNKIDQFV